MTYEEWRAAEEARHQEWLAERAAHYAAEEARIARELAEDEAAREAAYAAYRAAREVHEAAEAVLRAEHEAAEAAFNAAREEYEAARAAWERELAAHEERDTDAWRAYEAAYQAWQDAVAAHENEDSDAWQAWRDAMAEYEAAYQAWRDAETDFEEAMVEYNRLREEFDYWFSNLNMTPEQLEQAWRDFRAEMEAFRELIERLLPDFDFENADHDDLVRAVEYARIEARRLANEGFSDSDLADTFLSACLDGSGNIINVQYGQVGNANEVVFGGQPTGATIDIAPGAVVYNREGSVEPQIIFSHGAQPGFYSFFGRATGNRLILFVFELTEEHVYELNRDPDLILVFNAPIETQQIHIDWDDVFIPYPPMPPVTDLLEEPTEPVPPEPFDRIPPTQPVPPDPFDRIPPTQPVPPEPFDRIPPTQPVPPDPFDRIPPTQPVPPDPFDRIPPTQPVPPDPFDLTQPIFTSNPWSGVFTWEGINLTPNPFGPFIPGTFTPPGGGGTPGNGGGTPGGGGGTDFVPPVMFVPDAGALTPEDAEPLIYAPGPEMPDAGAYEVIELPEVPLAPSGMDDSGISVMLPIVLLTAVVGAGLSSILLLPFRKKHNEEENEIEA